MSAQRKTPNSLATGSGLMSNNNEMRLNKMNTTTAPKAVKAVAQAVVTNIRPRSLHEPFSWLTEESQHNGDAQLVATTLDMCNGLVTCLELIHSSNQERIFNEDADPGEEDSPILSVNDTERLLRLALASVTLMAAAASDNIEFRNRRANAARSS